MPLISFFTSFTRPLQCHRSAMTHCKDEVDFSPDASEMEIQSPQMSEAVATCNTQANSSTSAPTEIPVEPEPNISIQLNPPKSKFWHVDMDSLRIFPHHMNDAVQFHSIVPPGLFHSYSDILRKTKMVNRNTSSVSGFPAETQPPGNFNFPEVCSHCHNFTYFVGQCAHCCTYNCPICLRLTITNGWQESKHPSFFIQNDKANDVKHLCPCCYHQFLLYYAPPPGEFLTPPPGTFHIKPPGTF